MRKFKYKKTGQVISTENKKQIDAWTKDNKWEEIVDTKSELELLQEEVANLKKENAKLKKQQSEKA